MKADGLVNEIPSFLLLKASVHCQPKEKWLKVVSFCNSSLH